MRTQEIKDLYEVYLKVQQTQEEMEQLDEKAPKRITKDAKNPRLMNNAGPARLHNPKKVDEETDLFDTILEYLVAEGYADTNEAALKIMANMSEEWRQSIVEADSLAAFQARREKRRAATKKKTGYEGHDYSKPPAQAAAEREERMRKFINKEG